MNLGLDDFRKNRLTVVFDGNCQLCNFSVQILRKADKINRLHFVPYQRLHSFYGHQILAGINEIPSDSVAVITQKGKVIVKSDAILFILKELGGIYRIFCLLKIIPRFIRDGFYNWIAKNRFRFFSNINDCSI